MHAAHQFRGLQRCGAHACGGGAARLRGEMREAAGERVALALQRVARAVALLQQALRLLRARRRSPVSALGRRAAVKTGSRRLHYSAYGGPPAVACAARSIQRVHNEPLFQPLCSASSCSVGMRSKKKTTNSKEERHRTCGKAAVREACGAGRGDRTANCVGTSGSAARPPTRPRTRSRSAARPRASPALPAASAASSAWRAPQQPLGMPVRKIVASWCHHMQAQRTRRLAHPAPAAEYAARAAGAATCSAATSALGGRHAAA